MPLRFRLEDLSPAQQEQVKRQISPSPKKANQTSQTKTPPARQPADDDFSVSDLKPPKSISSAQPQNLRADKMSSVEKEYLRDVLHGNGLFEAITLKSPSGNRYTGDLFTILDGVPTIIETKGSYRLGSEGRAHTAFLEAASNFSQIFQFVWVKRIKKGVWEQKLFIPKHQTTIPSSTAVTH